MTFFVIARKMLIKTGAFYELLIGVAALAGLFAIRKDLAGRRPDAQLGTRASSGPHVY